VARDKPMPGLIEFFAFLRKQDIHFVLATNNARAPPAIRR